MLYHSVTYPYAHNHAQTSEDIAIAHIYQKRRGEMWLKEETANCSFHRESYEMWLVIKSCELGEGSTLNSLFLELWRRSLPGSETCSFPLRAYITIRIILFHLHRKKIIKQDSFLQNFLVPKISFTSTRNLKRSQTPRPTPSDLGR